MSSLFVSSLMRNARSFQAQGPTVGAMGLGADVDVAINSTRFPLNILKPSR